MCDIEDNIEDKPKKSGPVFWCKACGASMRPKKRKPVTTFMGEMESVYSEPVKDFPRNEWEDMCPVCIGEIRNYNADMSKADKDIHGSKKFMTWTPFHEYNPVRLDNGQDKMEEECSELRMDVEFRYSQSVYDGSINE